MCVRCGRFLFMVFFGEGMSGGNADVYVCDRMSIGWIERIVKDGKKVEST